MLFIASISAHLYIEILSYDVFKFTFMKKMTLRILLLIVITFHLPNMASAQWWNLYGPGSLVETIETSNGDLVAVGSFSNAVPGLTEGLVLRTDAEGNERWRLTLPSSSLNSSVSRVAEAADGSILVVYNHFEPGGIGLTAIYKISSDGNVIWDRPMNGIDNFRIWTLLEDPVTGNIVINATGAGSDSILQTITILDNNGDLQNQKILQGTGFCCSDHNKSKLVAIPDGYITAWSDSIYRLDHALDIVWSKKAPGAEVRALVKTAQNDFITVSLDPYDFGGTNANLFMFDENGTIAWDTSYFVSYQVFEGIVKNPNGEFKVIYKDNNFLPIGITDPQVFYRTFDAVGTLGPRETLSSNFVEALNVTQTNNGDIVFAGSIEVFPSNVSSGFLLRTDCEFTGFNNLISGRVYVDEDVDCMYDSTEQLLVNYPIQFIHDSGISFYGTSDSTGAYSVEMFNGNYQVSAIPQSPYEIPCTPEIINLSLGDTTVLADLPIQHIIECPLMTVSVGASFLRRCFENIHHIRYCNAGTSAAEDSYLEIELDSFMIFESASIPLTSQIGSLLTFDLGDVATGYCDVFTITTTLSCEAELGQNHCISAHIYPDSICLTNSPDWDGSSIQVSAQCTEDSVRFFINNLGAGDMLAPLEYIVIQDEILFSQDQFQINSGSSIQKSFFADGSTYRMEAMQAAGHPGFSMPSVTVEGCGAWPFATGFFGYFPQDDQDSFIDIDCQENIGAYDPNDKSAFPIGYGEDHVIDPESFIEYKIRFQNTGTDTAFNVAIRDTLSDLLDITTLRMGASSHSYNWRLEDQGTLVLDFPNILLPDSTTNLSKSNGFVSFKIQVKPVPSLPYSSIKNKAAIYFDFNEPIITNEVFHTIDTMFIDIVSSTKSINPLNNRVKLAPNPANDYTTLTFPEDAEFPLTIRLYSQDGRLIRTEALNNNLEEVDLKNLTTGIYYYGIYDKNGHWATGKLVVQR